jgi:hypothetical protein
MIGLFDENTLNLRYGGKGPETLEDLVLEEMAALEFEACGPEILKPFTQPAWGAETLAIGQYLRVAACALMRPKPELLEGLKNMLSDGQEGEDSLDKIIVGLVDTKRRLQDFGKLLDAALARMTAALAAFVTNKTE